MSVLNGSISSSVIHPEDTPFGKPLPLDCQIPLPGCADVAVSADGSTAYVACRDMVVTYDLRKEMKPKELGRIYGVQTSRQIAVSQDGIVFVTTRPDGLFIIDARDPENLSLLSHLDTLELATGVCAANGLCLVANRHMGVEIWDVSNPAAPKYCSSFYAGEAQSVCVDGGYAYVGDWMNKRVFIASIKDPCKPEIISSFYIDGFADGVFVRNGLCLAASGHHSASLKNRQKYNNYPYMTAEMIRDGYGCGHGLSLFDVSLPDAPAFLSEIKFPPFFGDVDTWRVTASGDFAYVADTHNGIFAVNISDPLSPKIVGYYQLPAEENTKNIPPTLQASHAAAMGVATGNGKLYVAGTDSGFHVLDFPPAKPAIPCAKAEEPCPAANIEKLFSCEGQVHSFVEDTGFLLLACGDDGLYALAEKEMTPRFHVQTEGIAHDIAQKDGYLIVAEGNRGVSSWRFSVNEGFAPVNRWVHTESGVRQIVPIPESDLIAVELDVGKIGFLRIGKDGDIRFVNSVSVGGILYHRHICRTVHASGYMAALPLARGVVWVNTKTLEMASSSWNLPKQGCPFEDGIATDGERIWMVNSRKCGYFQDPAMTAKVLATDTMKSVEGAELRGMPFVSGNTLILLHRIFGTMERLDIGNPDAPRLLDRTVLPGHPEYVAAVNGRCYIACGHEGLFGVKSSFEK